MGIVFELNLQQESDGFRRFYAHLLALYFSLRNQSFIFEELYNQSSKVLQHLLELERMLQSGS